MENIESESVEKKSEPKVQPVQKTEYQAPPKKKKGCLWWAVGIFLFLFFGGGLLMLIAIFASILSFVEGKTSFPTMNPAYAAIKETVTQGNSFSSNKIAVIDISGVISNAEESWGGTIANSTFICNQLSKAADDPEVKAVILRLNTPGGEVTAADMIYHEVKKFREQTGKPVVVCMQSVAASGGVYIAVASDYIIANKLTTTGSIGVIAEGYNYTELFKKIGLKAEVYKSGPMKDLMNGARPRTPEEKRIMNEFIGEVYNDFVKVVAEGRPKLTVERIKNTPIGDGRFYSGRKALEYGLVDSLGYFEDSVDKAAAMAGIKDYKVVVYQQMTGLAALLMNMKSSPKTIKVALPGAAQGIELPKSGKFFLLPPTW